MITQTIRQLDGESAFVRIYSSKPRMPLIANPTIWTPAFPECSPPAMFAMGLSNDAPRLSGKAQWLLPWFTGMWPAPERKTKLPH